MAITTKKINVTLEYFFKKVKEFRNNSKLINEGIDRQRELFTSLTPAQKRFNDNLAMNRIANKGFFQTMKMGQNDFKKFNEQGRKFNNLGGKTANWIRKSTHGLRGFRMEMLGVMFFGMTMNRTFMGLLKTSIDWLGVTEILAAALGILFLPVAEMLLNWAIIFLNYVDSLTIEQKKWIGQIVLLGAAIGGVLTIFGILALGIGSLILAFKFLFSPINLIITILLALAGISLVGMFSDLFSEVDGAGEKLTSFGITGDMLMKVKNKIGEVIGKIKERLIESWPEIKEHGVELLNKIVDGIKDNSQKIGDAMESLLSAIGTWLGENADKFLEIGFNIISGIFKGITKGAFNFGVEIGNKISENINENRDIGFTERISSSYPFNRNQNQISMNPIYNVSVADTRVFEDMLRNNNEELMRDFRRLTQQ